MTMTIKPLPDAVQTLFCASTRTNTYKRAIEELVYNALDAKATSIAIRLDIPVSTIQVIDNGYGITKTDMKRIGGKYMTSKTVDLSSLKSMPNFYGYHGQSLASLIEVSQVVKITSRVDGTDETWIKTYSKGRERNIATTTTRPSKGTTVEVQGFLYNLMIQKKAVNPLIEQQDIKHFLQQLSLIHNNVSVSLRDNSNNDIIFQIHKCRDIYQTFSTLFSLQKDQFRELQVEKRLYKVNAYIGKGLINNDNYHWVYLNGRFVPGCRLHKILDINMTKLLGLTNKRRKKIRLANDFQDEEDSLFKGNIPFYFVFITCPYNDYSINETSKILELEFRDWNNITKILEKLVFFYVGDMNLKEVHQVTSRDVREAPQDTRDEVKKIMEKILASNTRKLGVSQMQNGIKGKLIKRKKNKIKDISLSKVLPKCDEQVKKIDFLEQSQISTNLIYESDQNKNKFETSNIKTTTKVSAIPPVIKKPIKQIKEVNIKTDKSLKRKNYCESKKTVETSKNERHGGIKIKRGKQAKVNILVKTFRDNPIVVKQRCQLLRNKVDRLREIQNIRRGNTPCCASYNENSNIKLQKKNQNDTKIQRVDEIVTHKTVPLQANLYPRKPPGILWNDIKNKQCISTYDLLQTILNSQDNVCGYSRLENSSDSDSAKGTIPPMPKINFAIPQLISNEYMSYKRQIRGNQEPSKSSAAPSSNISLCGPRLTYESHTYYRRQKHESSALQKSYYANHKLSNGRFITKQSKDNFTLQQNKLNQRMRFKPPKRCYAKNSRKLLILKNLDTHREHSCTIEFTQTNKASSSKTNPENGMSKMTFNNIDKAHNILGQNMYTVNREDDHMNAITSLFLNGTYTISKMTFQSQQIERYVDFVAPRECQNAFMTVNSFKESILNSYTSTNTIEDSRGKSCGTYCVRNSVKKVNKQTSPLHNMNMRSISIEEDRETPDLNIVCFSKSQDLFKGITAPDQDPLDPLKICETILNGHESFEEELHSHHISPGDLSIPSDAMATCNDVEEISHHFQKNERSFPSLVPLATEAFENPKPVTPCKEHLKPPDKTELKRFTKYGQDFVLNETTGMIFKNNHKDEVKSSRASEFSIKNRPRYIPKGMSPIFENCKTKNACHYDLDEVYFADSMYDDFAKAVDVNAEIFESNVDDMNDLATKEINRVNYRLKKDNASLCFVGENLREAKVLGQVDSKFIAAKIIGKSVRTETMKEYLVLFDQHAVHERICLEKNLSEYLSGKQWKSVTLDNVAIKLKPDEILFLHNYKDKLEQLGLQWTVEGKDEVSVTAIPEAIIGKNPRQVEIIVKSVKSCILEEIEAIKIQKGSISMYPKSIMNLVFSEACRYAIKFGDRLAHNDCVRLLWELSECKTPFQCAHGRPVMAVLMEVKPIFNVYKINMSKLRVFKENK